MCPFTFMHLADAFIQSDLCIQAIHLYCQYVCSLGIDPTTFALLTQCSTTEPHELLDGNPWVGHLDVNIMRCPSVLDCLSVCVFIAA